MNSRILLILAILALAVGCGDFERGEPLPAEAPTEEAAGPTTDTTDTGGEGGGEAVPFAASYDILMSKCSSCHGASSSNAFGLTGDPDDDYNAVVSLVDTSNPAESRLLQKGSGSTSHGGGPVIATGTPDYETILNWIAAGAQQ